MNLNLLVQNSKILGVLTLETSQAYVCEDCVWPKSVIGVVSIKNNTSVPVGFIHTEYTWDGTGVIPKVN